MRFSLVIVFVLGLVVICSGQTKTDSLIVAIEEAYGKEKLLLYHELIEEYFDDNETKKALKAARQSTALADRIISIDNDLITEDDLVLKPASYYLMGKAYYKRKQYTYSKSYFQATIRASLDLLRTDYIEDSERFIAKIEARDPTQEKKFFSKLKELERGVAKTIIDGSSDIGINTTLKLARNYEAKENYPKAIEKYEKAINLLKDQGESQDVIKLTQHVADLHKKLGNYGSAIETYEQVSSIHQNSGDSLGADQSQQKIEEVITEMKEVIGESNPATNRPRSTVSSILPRSEIQTNTDQLKNLASQYEQREDYEQSLSYYKLYIEANEKLKEEEYNRELALLEQSNELENRDKELALLQQEKELQDLTLARNNEELVRQERFRNSLIIGSVLLLSLALALYFLYRNKKKAHSDLTSAYDDLNETQKKLSSAEKRIKTLLKQQVSGAVAQELLSEKVDEKITQRFVCIMFLDIRGFTPFAETRSPEDIIQYQNDIFGFMIDIIESNNGVINQFLGDGFMATFGAPVSSDNDCENAYQSAIKIVQTLNKLNDDNKIPHTRVGIGLHAGPVVAGNVGTEERKQYSITGNTVILASRIEQLNKQFNTQLIISEDVYDHLEAKDQLDPDYEDVTVKGRSEPIRIRKVA